LFFRIRSIPTLPRIASPFAHHTIFCALSWFVVATLLALWSLVTWALHAVAVWAVSNAGALSGAASGAGTLALPDWLSSWVPPAFVQAMTQWMASLGLLVDRLLHAAPALAGGLTVATWVVWGTGAVLLLLLCAGVHLPTALWRRRSGRESGPNAGPTLAAG
jgi:hypothetical protein